MTANRPFWRRPAFLVAGSIIVVAGLAIAVWLIRPLFVDDVVDEAFPVETAPMVDSTVASTAPQSTEPPMDDSTTTSTSTTVASADTIAVLAGAFTGTDDLHLGEGLATIYELSSGRQVLRFEDFDVTNGPDLRVLLVPVADPKTSEEVHTDGYVELGELKGNVGDQNYDLPGSVDLSSGEWSVVIYCDPFSVIFATASLDQG